MLEVLGLAVLCITLGVTIFVLLRVMSLDNTGGNIGKEISDLKLHEQNQYMQMSKTLSEDLSQLKDKLHESINNYSEKTIVGYMSFKNTLTADLYEFSTKIQGDMIKLFEGLNKNVSEELEKINNRVELRLNAGFEKTTQTFNSILERISKIDEAQKKIENLSTDIISLQDVLTDKKSRGTFGEIQLKQILVATFGENNTKIYELQKKLSNDKIADAILHTPKPLGSICIDSKFPLDNYKKMIDKSLSAEEISLHERKFKQDVKKHIDDIQSKYILIDETADSAIMFIPAEAIFAEINAYHQDLINYSQQAQVWITSPTTLMFLLATVQVILQNIERDKYSAIIHEELNKLGVEFKRYKDRWDKLSRSIKQVSKNVDDLHKTSDKIEKRFSSISSAEIETKEIEMDNLDIEEEENE